MLCASSRFVIRVSIARTARKMSQEYEVIGCFCICCYNYFLKMKIFWNIFEKNPFDWSYFSSFSYKNRVIKIQRLRSTTYRHTPKLIRDCQHQHNLKCSIGVITRSSWPVVRETECPERRTLVRSLYHILQRPVSEWHWKWSCIQPNRRRAIHW